MAITSAGRDPDLIIPIGAADKFTQTFNKFKSKGLSAAASVEGGFSKAGKTAKKTLSAIGSAAKQMAKVTVAAFTAISAAIIYANVKGDEFEEALISMGRVTKQPREEIKTSLLGVAPILGNLTDLTKGYYQVISAGVTAPKRALETLTQASKISKITHLEQGEVVKGLTKVMAGYGDEIKNVAQASDILFTIEKVGQTSVGELIPVIGGLSKSAADLNINVYEMGAGLAQITQYAGNTDEAATQLRAVFTALLKPSEDLTTALSKAGIESVSLALKNDGLAGVLKKLKEASGGTDEGLRKLFSNVRAASGAAALAAGDFQGLESRISEMKGGIGAAADAWNDWEKSGTAATGRLRANLDNFLIKLGEAFKLTGIKNSISDLIENYGDRLITTFTNLPEIGRRSFQLLLDFYIRLIDDRVFRESFASNAVIAFENIVKNFTIAMGSLGTIIYHASSLIWKPLITNFTDSMSVLGLQMEIQVGGMIAAVEGASLRMSESINGVIKNLIETASKIPLIGDKFKNIPTLDGWVRLNQEAYNSWIEYINERQGEIVDILAGKNLSAAADSIIDHLKSIAPEFENIKIQGGDSIAALKTLLASLGDSPEYAKFKADIAALLAPPIDTSASQAYADALYAQVNQSAAARAEDTQNQVDSDNAKLAYKGQYYSSYLRLVWDANAETRKIEDKRRADDLEAEKKNSRLKIQAVQGTASNIVSVFQSLDQVNESRNRSVFDALKLARAAETIVNTYAAATLALATYPPPFSFIAAGAAVAAGLANLAVINSTQFGSTATASTTAYENPLTTTPTITTPTTTTNTQIPRIPSQQNETLPAQNISFTIINPLGSENWDDIAENQIIPALKRAGERDINVTVEAA